jgi:hypothetical protein
VVFLQIIYIFKICEKWMDQCCQVLNGRLCSFYRLYIYSKFVKNGRVIVARSWIGGCVFLQII